MFDSMQQNIYQYFKDLLHTITMLNWSLLQHHFLPYFIYIQALVFVPFRFLLCKTFNMCRFWPV